MRLDEVTETLGDRVQLEWKTFLLRVEPKTDDHEAFVEYTKSWLRPAEMEPRTNFTLWASDEGQPPSSVPAQVAHKMVTSMDSEASLPYHHALLKAYFTDNRNIGDAETLLDIAAETGIDRDALVSLAEERQEEFTQRVIVEHNAALQLQVNAVPTVVLDGGLAIPGAQPAEAYIRLIERIEEKRASA